MAGAIAEAFYGGVPSEIANQALLRLDEPLKLVLQAFIAKFSSNYNYNTQVASH
jgi:ADP-ribosylglycohydrolase